MQKYNNIVIGAGISGLSCASVLKDCVVLEKENFIGGLSSTIQFKDFKFDLGGHRFFTNNKSMDVFFKNLLKDEIIETFRKSQIYKNGKLIDYPLRVSIIFKLSPFEIMLAVTSLIYRKINPLRENSFEEKAKNLFGDYLYRTFFRDYTVKVWGISCNNISEELVDARLQQVSLIRAIKHAFIKYKNIKSFADKVIYPKSGIIRVSELLSKDLDVRLNKEVTGIVCSDSRIEKIIVNNSEEFLCKNVVSTMPLTRLLELLNPPEAIEKAVKNLKYRSLICVFLVLNKKFHTDNHWIYLHDTAVSGRLHEPKNWSPYMAPKDKTGICIEIFCNKDDEVWKRTDIEIVYEVIKDLPFIERFEIEDHFVARAKYAYPIYDINYLENLKIVKDFISSYENLFLLGRTGSFKYINMDACMEEGLMLGSSINLST